ncbi:hypothetical protein VTP01DRAFT_5167 [Rhizomucor pusillus]|uniref:uncharacterized protein n=1 Tax=Rhizomucor pusillus TaxID=4840 RepID=UPI003741EF67
MQEIDESDPITTRMTIDDMVIEEIQSSFTERSPAPESRKEAKIEEPKERGSRQPYNRYSPEQIHKFITLLQEEGLSVTEAAQKTRIPRSSAYKLRKEWNDIDGAVLPGLKDDGRKRGNNTKFGEEHSAFNINYIDKNPTTTADQTTKALCAPLKDSL